MTSLPTRSDFVGQWQVQRTIHDHRASATGQFKGIATFEPQASHLAYYETGYLHLHNQASFKAERRYLWRFEKGQILIDFDDGRFFHSIAADHPQARHWCDPDQYDVHYDFAEWPRWHSAWDVSGPRKAYHMNTTYERVTAE